MIRKIYKDQVRRVVIRATVAALICNVLFFIGITCLAVGFATFLVAPLLVVVFTDNIAWLGLYATHVALVAYTEGVGR
jgi:hypothetical protein